MVINHQWQQLIRCLIIRDIIPFTGTLSAHAVTNNLISQNHPSNSWCINVMSFRWAKVVCDRQSLCSKITCRCFHTPLYQCRNHSYHWCHVTSGYVRALLFATPGFECVSWAFPLAVYSVVLKFQKWTNPCCFMQCSWSVVAIWHWSIPILLKFLDGGRNQLVISLSMLNGSQDSSVHRNVHVLFGPVGPKGKTHQQQFVKALLTNNFWQG